MLFRLNPQPEAHVDTLSLLSVAERERASRFRFERDGLRYAVCRAQLRQILATDLGVPAADIPIEYGSHGKPALGGQWAQCGVRFNLSHSSDLALIGITRGPEIGVDLEFRRHVTYAASIAARYLPADGDGACSGFFERWTRHEATVKARGRGLLHTADVATDAAGHWCSVNFEPAAGFIAAVATQGRYCELRTVQASQNGCLT